MSETIEGHSSSTENLYTTKAIKTFKNAHSSRIASNRFSHHANILAESNQKRKQACENHVIMKSKADEPTSEVLIKTQTSGEVGVRRGREGEKQG